MLGRGHQWRIDTRAAWLGLFLLALGLRLGYFFEFSATPYAQNPIIDAQAYDRLAWQIAEGDWLGSRIFYQDPLYPYALAGVYRVFGHHYPPVYLLQHFLGAALCVVAALLARSVFRDHPKREQLTWGTGLLCALCTPAIFYEGLLVKTSLGLFLSTLHLWLIERLGRRGESGASRGRLMATACGGLLGLLLLNRGNYLLLAPFFALWLAWRWGLGDARRRTGALVATALYTIGVLAVVLPVTLRNYVVGDQWVLITSQGGQNFWLGNNAINITGSYVTNGEIRASPRFEQSDFLAKARRETGRDMQPVEVSRYFFASAFDWIAAHPADALTLYGKKWGLWMAGLELSDNYDFSFVQHEFSRLLRLPLSTGYTLGVLGWSALLLSLLLPRQWTGSLGWRGNPSLVLLLGFVLLYSFSITAFFVFSRYRLPIYPVLAILASAWLCWLFREWRSLGWKAKLGALTPLLVSAFFVMRPITQPGWGHWSLTDFSVEYYNLGLIELEGGRETEGFRYFEKALQLEKVNDVALLEIGLSYQRVGELAKARSSFKRLVDQAPGHAQGWLKLGYLLALNGGHDRAEAAFMNAKKLEPDLAESYLHLGTLYRVKHRPKEARQAYLAFLARADASDQDLWKGMVDASLELLTAGDRESTEASFGALRSIPVRQLTRPWRLKRLLAIPVRDPENARQLHQLLSDLLESTAPKPSHRSPIVSRLRELEGRWNL